MLSKKANEKRHEPSRNLKERAIDEFPAASALLLGEGEKLTLDTAAATVEAGAAGVAVISAVLGVPDPEQAARRLLKAVTDQV